MGITPGGATPASFMSYGLAKRFSKRGDNFGKGEIEGVVAPETAAHAAGTSALLPMLTLGIPGSPTAAVLLGGLMIWGLQPGPMLFIEQKDFVWGLIASMYLGNIAGLIVVLTCVPLFAAILRVPFSIIAPIILVICAVGAYTVHNSMFDVWMMLVFGVIGYVFHKLGYPLPPLVLAIVLGDKAEESFRQAMLGSQGSLAIFWSNWLVGSIMTLGMILLFWPLMTWPGRPTQGLAIRRRSRHRPEPPPSIGRSRDDFDSEHPQPARNTNGSINSRNEAQMRRSSAAGWPAWRCSVRRRLSCRPAGPATAQGWEPSQARAIRHPRRHRRRRRPDGALHPGRGRQEQPDEAADHHRQQGRRRGRGRLPRGQEVERRCRTSSSSRCPTCSPRPTPPACRSAGRT